MSFRARPAITALTAAVLFAAGGVALGGRSVALAASSGESGYAASPAPAPTFVQPAGWPTVQSASLSAETVGPGVRYERWLLSTDAGPLVVSLAVVDLRDPSVALAIATHDNVIIGKGERLSSMADRLGAELGINADYFDINESGSPLNLVATDERVLHSQIERRPSWSTPRAA